MQSDEADLRDEVDSSIGKKDLIPIYGFFKYMSRTEKDDSTKTIVNSCLIVLYNVVGISLLEKLTMGKSSLEKIFEYYF